MHIFRAKIQKSDNPSVLNSQKFKYFLDFTLSKCISLARKFKHLNFEGFNNFEFQEKKISYYPSVCLIKRLISTLSVSEMSGTGLTVTFCG